jgi:cell shape-determining protein MreD
MGADGKPRGGAVRLKITILAAATLVIQRALGMPGMPAWCSHIIFPMVWLVALSLLRKERHWPYEALLLGLAWDLLFGPVVGPGGIAWTAACLSLYGLASVVADRSPRAWVAFGAVGALVVVLVRRLALMPLDLATSLTFGGLAWSALLTGLWCGVVGVALAFDLADHWRAYRVRKLR